MSTEPYWKPPRSEQPQNQDAAYGYIAMLLVRLDQHIQTLVDTGQDKDAKKWEVKRDRIQDVMTRLEKKTISPEAAREIAFEIAKSF